MSKRASSVSMKSSSFRSRLFAFFFGGVWGLWFSSPEIALMTDDAVIAPSLGMVTVVVAIIRSELLSSVSLCVDTRFLNFALGLCSFQSRFLWRCCMTMLLSKSSSDLDKLLMSLSMDAVESNSAMGLRLRKKSKWVKIGQWGLCRIWSRFWFTKSFWTEYYCNAHLKLTGVFPLSRRWIVFHRSIKDLEPLQLVVPKSQSHKLSTNFVLIV